MTEEKRMFFFLTKNQVNINFTELAEKNDSVFIEGKRKHPLYSVLPWAWYSGTGTSY